MKDHRYTWNLKKDDNQDLVQELTQQTKFSPAVIRVLLNRGFKTAEEINQFINIDAKIIHDPFLLHDMQKVVDRIFQAVENNEKILVYGDYDADGVTSTTIMFETLDQLGANVIYYVPDRFKDGYGPNLNEYQHFIEEEQVQLIITVDNGVAGVEPIEYAQSKGVDVIVTDHHELPDVLPKAYAIVHPRYPNTEYPFGDLSGVGVAFKVAAALLEEIPEEFLDLYAIGTVADLVSMTDENRFLVKMGLEVLKNTTRIGLKELIKVADIDEKQIDEQSIGFTIAPRINAVGRLKNASIAVKLLTTFDENEAVKLAKEINDTNVNRQSLVAKIYDEAKQIALKTENEQRQTLIIAGHNWHQGVLGIVASRIVELTNKPTIVLSDTDNNNIFKGSGRSVASLNLFKAINAKRDDYIGFGGHHMAIGITISGDNLNILAQELEQSAQKVQLDHTKKPELDVDTYLSLNDVSEHLLSEIKELGPFGNGNKEPKFIFKDLTVNQARAIGKDNQHLKLELSDKNLKINAIAFKLGQLADTLNNINNEIDVVGTLNRNEWKNVVSLQIMVDDLKIEGIQIVDKRTNNLNRAMFNEEGTYIVFHQKLLEMLEQQNITQPILMYNQLANQVLDKIILVDFPNDLTDLKEIFQQINPTKVVAYLFHQNDAYAEGMPIRDDFKALFALITKQNLQKKDLLNVAKQLKVTKNQLTFMLNVFFELGFVRIVDGFLKINQDVKPQDLKNAPAYQKRLNLMEAQEKLLYSNGSDFSKWFNEISGNS